MAYEYLFGPYRFQPERQLLMRGDASVALGGRARDILAVLLERRGSVVTKQELFALVWPNRTVEDGNLKFNVATLRKALGDGQDGARYIANVPGRGYAFVAEVAIEEQGRAEATPLPAEREQALADPSLRLIGRSDEIARIETRLRQYRFVTVVGPGGIGKTTVARAAAARLGRQLTDGMRFVDLTPVADPALAPSVVATALGVPVHTDDPIDGLVALLKDKRILIVLDNCEHVIEPMAAFAEAAIRDCPGVHILATSREHLRAGGERVYRLPPLAAPPPAEGLSAAEVMAFPAAQLFVERASAASDEFELTDALAASVAEICRKLDGLALAIEIVAGRVDAFGVGELASRLDDRFRLSVQGLRTAQARHQTLRTTMDWSYGLLPETEKATLRRLAIFVDAFTRDAAEALLGDAAAEAIANLVSKSLISASVEGDRTRYKLLSTTRIYALLRLDESGERDEWARRHARYHADLLAAAEIQWHERLAADWLGAFGPLLGEARSALDWAFSRSGDVELGITLTGLAVPLWFQLSLLNECHDRIERVLYRSKANLDLRSEMRLRAALAGALKQSQGSTERTRAEWTAVAQLAEKLGDIDYQLRALWGLWAELLNGARLRDALALAEKFYVLAGDSNEPSDLFVGDRMVGYILHLLGEQEAARPRIERMLLNYEMPVTGASIARFIFEQRATARCFLARILWLQGRPDQALIEVDHALSEAGHDALTLCQALVQAACPIAIFVGDLDRLQPHVETLLDLSARNGWGFWRTWGNCFNGVLLVKRGELKAGLEQLRVGLDELRRMQYGVYYIVFMCEYAEALGRDKRPAQAMIAIDEALARARRNEENWYVPELLRIRAMLLLWSGEMQIGEADKLLEQALALARRQGAIAWELRVAVDLARLLRDRGQFRAGERRLRSALAKFTQGFATRDLESANDLLAELGARPSAETDPHPPRSALDSQPRSLAHGWRS